MNIYKIKGFTIVELMVTVGIVSILLAVGLPSLQETMDRVDTNSQIKSLVASLNFARSEAVKRGVEVSVCPSSLGIDCAADTWSDGWLVFVDANDDADGTAGSVDLGDTVLRVYQYSGNNILTYSAAIQQYNSQGFGTNDASQTFLLCPGSGDANNAQSLEVSVIGRGRRINTGLSC
jgi:type IV fimbrial biogenesis protein FimT